MAGGVGGGGGLRGGGARHKGGGQQDGQQDHDAPMRRPQRLSHDGPPNQRSNSAGQSATTPGRMIRRNPAPAPLATGSIRCTPANTNGIPNTTPNAAYKVNSRTNHSAAVIMRSSQSLSSFST